jgi:uncharacterized Ntn-hydrolase superfamily protein
MHSINEVFLKLAALAKETTRNYASDFYLHDAAILFAMKPGDIALWAARENGSALVIVTRQGIVNKQALESFNAYNDTFADLRWQVIDTDFNRKWTTYEASFPKEIIAEWQEATNDYEKSCKAEGKEPRVVSELHM